MRTSRTHLNSIPESRPSHIPTQQPDRRNQPRTRPARTDTAQAQGQPQPTHPPLRHNLDPEPPHKICKIRSELSIVNSESCSENKQKSRRHSSHCAMNLARDDPTKSEQLSRHSKIEPEEPVKR